MKISEVRIRKVEKEDTKLKAIASITIDECFVVHDIKIIEGAEGLFIAMPSRKTKEGEYKDIAHPINPETRKDMSDIILEAYAKEIAVAE
ncbi:MAG: septation regulator SpoVG [Clostridia bacterium]